MTERKEAAKGEDISNFKIVVRSMNEKDLKTMCPFEFGVTQSSASATLLTIRTDQSGLIGMLRHLHHRGIMLLSVNREE